MTTGLAGTVSHCGICGHWDLRPVLDMGMQPLAERYGSDMRYPLVLLECQACTLVQLSYIAPPREVFPPDHPYATGSTRALRDHFTALTRDLGKDLPPGSIVADLGANDGTLLGGYSRLLERVAVEPTGQARKCREKGFTTYQEPFTAVLAARIRADCDGPAQVITACNVLAHVPDPHDFTAGVARLLAGDGIFVTENHDVNSVLDGLQVDTVYHEHARFYSVTSLSRLLQAHGLVITDVRKIATHGGSFRVTARRQRTGDLERRTQDAAATLREKVSLAFTEGPVYGIGATTRATPLIHYAGIASYLSCVCEVPGSDKIGLTMPGTSIPVVDEAKLIADQPPHALLLSWHLADTIVPLLRAKGYRGGIIVPLPEPRMIRG